MPRIHSRNTYNPYESKDNQNKNINFNPANYNTHLNTYAEIYKYIAKPDNSSIT